MLFDPVELIQREADSNAERVFGLLFADVLYDAMKKSNATVITKIDEGSLKTWLSTEIKKFITLEEFTEKSKEIKDPNQLFFMGIIKGVVESSKYLTLNIPKTAVKFVSNQEEVAEPIPIIDETTKNELLDDISKMIKDDRIKDVTLNLSNKVAQYIEKDNKEIKDDIERDKTKFENLDIEPVEVTDENPEEDLTSDDYADTNTPEYGDDLSDSQTVTGQGYEPGDGESPVDYDANSDAAMEAAPDETSDVAGPSQDDVDQLTVNNATIANDATDVANDNGDNSVDDFGDMDLPESDEYSTNIDTTDAEVESGMTQADGDEGTTDIATDDGLSLDEKLPDNEKITISAGEPISPEEYLTDRDKLTDDQIATDTSDEDRPENLTESVMNSFLIHLEGVFENVQDSLEEIKTDIGYRTEVYSAIGNLLCYLKLFTLKEFADKADMVINETMSITVPEDDEDNFLEADDEDEILSNDGPIDNDNTMDEYEDLGI